MERHILPLDPQTRTHLRSTQIIASLSQLVLELVQNSLDAGATQIEVGINAPEWECWVRDNGSGISKSGLEILSQGSIDGRYGSSKAYEISSLDSVSTFGFRGEALASVADICCLEISSRTKLSKETWSLISKGGDRLHYGPAIRWRLERPGTVVCVRDAFYNLPVRRKAHTQPTKTVDLIKKDLQVTSLVFPHVAFTLEDTSSHHLMASRVKLLSISRSSSTLASFRGIFGRALAEHVNLIHEEDSGIRINGFISLDGATSKAYQFLYINNHIINPCSLHHIIDSQFSMSSFGKHAFQEDGETSARPTTRRSPRKNEKLPVYVLNITLPRSNVDSLLEPSKKSVHIANSDEVHALVSSTVKNFLRRNSFIHSAQAQSLMTEGIDPCMVDEEISLKMPKITLLSPTKPTTSNLKEQKLSRNVSKVTHTSHPRRSIAAYENCQRTQTHAQKRSLESSIAEDRQPAEYPTCGAKPATDQGIRKVANMDKKPAWMQDSLKDWVNPVFRIGERSHRPKVNPKQNVAFTVDDLKSAHLIGQVDEKFIACVLRDLPDDESVVILIDQHAADERIRVERLLEDYCRYALQQRSLGVEDGSTFRFGGTACLEPPIKILLTKEEAHLVRRHDVLEEFARWGIHFENGPEYSVETAGDNDRVQLAVTQVPVLLHEKLSHSEELQSVVKDTLGQILETGLSLWPRLGEEANGMNVDWLRALKHCPQSLLSLINSKACRGAIMFNDSLSMDQCSRLVSQLSETIFPFQCAHGRPSITPLLSVADFSKLYSRQSQPNKRASSRLLDWKRFDTQSNQQHKQVQS